MRTVPVKEVLEFEIGEGVPQTKGLVKAVFPIREGIGKDKDGSVQNFILADGQDEIKVVCWDREDLMPLKGHQVWIMSYKGKGDKLAGVTVKLNNYTSKTGRAISEKVIEVAKGAVIARQDAQQSLPAVTGQASEDADGDLGPQTTAKPATTYKPELGARVGMCMNLAVEIVSKMDGNPFTPVFYKQVHEVASDLLRVSHMLEDGKLAVNIKERVKAQEPQPF